MSDAKDLHLSIMLTICGAVFGLQAGGKIGGYLDARTMEALGRSSHSYFYWGIRLAITGAVAGLITGAICGYFMARKNK